MNILIIGSGGREHAIAWKTAQSPLCTNLFIAPGNAGTADLGKNLPIKADDFAGLVNTTVENKIDFVIVGPDDPLALGIVDFFKADARTANIPILGPKADGAKLESSKAFAKQFMQKYNIPTSDYQSFTREQNDAAYNYIEKNAYPDGRRTLPIVIKADGLAAGKGVAVCSTLREAKNFLDEIWAENKFGSSGDKVIIEQFLSGIELSVFILTDGKKYILLPEAKDYKRIGEGDTGPNTGGMGSVSPVPFADKNFMQKVINKVIEPTVTGLQKENIDYRGFIFFGLINVGGEPYVIEYNARMGDPETQVVFPRVKTDLVPFMLQAANGKLENTEIEINPLCAASVIAVSKGYPEKAETGKEISGLENITESIVFHAGTKADGDKILTSGGRVMAVVSFGENLNEALEKSYSGIQKIHFEGIGYRKDIGKDLQNLAVNQS